MRVLFVCSGNTCRSPMAEGYLSSKNIKGIEVSSAGFMSEGERVSKNAEAVMNEIGIDISAHTSRLISKECTAYEKIFCMGESHRLALISAGFSQGKITVLGGGVSDPFGGSLTVYRQCRDEIISAVNSALYGGEILPFAILPAEKADIPAIAELESECFTCPWSENAILESMEHNTVFFKAVHNKKTVGYISVTAVSDEGYINNIAVKGDCRNMGIGSVLLDRAVTFSHKRRLEFISLEVRASNATAISLYKNAGFINAGTRKNFYDNPKEDGIIMTRRFKYADTLY